jgi:signal transduction histidine kinase
VRINVTEDSGHVGFAVLDSGRGVAAEDRAKVFKRFERLDSMSGHGLGLGLSVVQGLVEAMGGDVRIEEAPGGGAAFRILFPRPKRSILEDALMEAVGLPATPIPPVPSSSVS